ncbi:MAG TPA: GNAT family N-acetyltransferase [Actinomycetota bacterium]|nr:GNAT family N-acetyltransferase [Actinomycetota bacterium]
MPDVRIVEREDLSSNELDDILAWLEVAFDDGPWRPEHWQDIGAGPHFMIDDEHGLAAHLCLVPISVQAGDVDLRAIYVEDVATRADRRGQGLGTALLRAAAPTIERESELGLLATGSHGFYARLGWVPWRGPLSVTEADGSTTRTTEEDGDVLALFVPGTPAGISPDLPLVRPRRDPEEAW